MNDHLSTALRAEFADVTEVLAELVTQKVRKSLLEKEILKPSEAAEWFGLTFSAFNQAPWKKELPVYKIGIQNRYRLSDLRKFIENRRVTGDLVPIVTKKKKRQ